MGNLFHGPTPFILLFVIILLFTLLQLWLSKRWVYYESEGK